MNECVAKPCFGMGFTNDKGKFSPLENFDQVLHSRHVHGFVIKFWMKTTFWCTSRKRRGLGKFSNGENLDILVRSPPTPYDSHNRAFT